jgi:hypothetical protein
MANSIGGFTQCQNIFLTFNLAKGDRGFLIDSFSRNNPFNPVR